MRSDELVNISKLDQSLPLFPVAKTVILPQPVPISIFDNDYVRARKM